MDVVEISDSQFSVNGVTFTFVVGGYTKTTTPDEIIVFKPLHYFLSYIEYAKQKGVAVTRMLELGIAEGGSAICFALLLPSAKVVAIDLRDPNPFVLEHLHRLGLADRVKLHYNTRQDDRAAISRIITEEFSRKIDLVVDDASHLYPESRASFEAILPYVQSGGIYVIEDWGWAHWPGEDGHAEIPALSNLIFELCMLTASRGDVVHEVKVDGGKVSVWINNTDQLPPTFQLTGSYRIEGRKFEPI